MQSLIDLNAAHLHLLLNHVPTLGAVVALGLLFLAFVRRDEGVKRVGLEVLFVIAVLTLPAYTTGTTAQRALRDLPEVSVTAMRAHQDAALVGFAVTELAGFVAWIALWQSRRRGRATRGIVPAAVVLTIVALALMARAATLGGMIRHPEIRPDLAANPIAAAGSTDSSLSAAITEVMVYSTWVWPAAEAVHFLGLSLSFGVLLAVNLRILGVMKQVPFADVHRLLPWGMLGFGVNLITGMLFFVGQPAQYIQNAPFQWKVVFLVIAGANFLYLTEFKQADGGRDAGLADKAMALASIAAWLAVLYAGRMLPFLGNAF